MLKNLLSSEKSSKFLSMSFDRISIGVIAVWFMAFVLCGVLMHITSEQIQQLISSMLGWWVVIGKLGCAALGWVIGNRRGDRTLKVWCTIAMGSISLMYILYFFGFEVIWQHVSAAGFNISELNDCVLLFYVLMKYVNENK